MKGYATAVPSADGGASSSSTVNFFSKDGRMISVGDCALFKPPQDSPPFIGIISCLTAGKEDKLKLGVNWLYRPAELKLGRDIVLEAAPNEVFYSIHKDEVPAESLLHPCKVAFLPKEVELPPWICSFVCRRVYDIKNKCLWWLTDRDFITVRQEVDQLLYKTRLEMQATVQPGGRSPKSMNGLTSTSQLKPGSDSVQNSASIFPSPGKEKKRECVDQGSDPVKRERTSRMDDGDLGHGRPEIVLKSEISKITEKGGLKDSEGVEKFVQLMIPERNEKKIDWVSRSMLAGVIAATENFDCLSHFVQLKGLHVFDEWLQEVHKGRIADGSSSKDDRSIDDFLLTLLRALDRLPVNLTALQMCNIGKSVNHLRSHKNIEIQKKARSLVDTWKKRVEAEMDAKSGSNQAVPWNARHRLSEVSQSGSKHCASPDPQTTTRDEKSSSSSQSCSSNHVKTGGVSGKEDTRSSAAGSRAVTKISGSSSRNRKSFNGFSGPSGVQRESGSSKNSSLHETPASEKLSQTGLTCEKEAGSLMTEANNSHKLVVKIPNRCRSPAKSASAGSLDDHSAMNGASIVRLEMHEQLDCNMKEKSDTYRENVITDVNTESWQSSDLKDVQTRCDEGDGSPAAVPDEHNCRPREDARKTTVVTKTVVSSSGNSVKSERMQEASSCSMDTLIDSCVKFSDADACIPVEDYAGMNLLASVAANECSKSDAGLPIDSSQRNTPIVRHSPTDNGTELKCSTGDEIIRDQSVYSSDDGNLKQGVVAGTSRTKSAGSKTGFSQEISGELTEHLTSSNMGLPHSADQFLENSKVKEITTATLVNLPSVSSVEKITDIADSKEHLETKAGGVDDDGSLDTKQSVSISVVNEVIINPVVEVDVEIKKNISDCFDRSPQSHQKQPAVIEHSTNGTNEEALPLSSAIETGLENVDEKVEKDVGTDARCRASQNEKQKSDCGSKAMATVLETEQSQIPLGSKLADAEAEHASTNTDAPTGSADMDAKVEFDLNEVFNVDEGKFGELKNLTVPGCSAPVQLISPLPFPASSVSSLPTSVTVAAAAKGHFVPPDDLLRTKGVLGWKGSAATSAFRPAEPRKTVDMLLDSTKTSIPDASTGKESRRPLDIDLNVPDERVLEDLASRTSAQGRDCAQDLTCSHDLRRGLMGSALIRSSGGIEFDLNTVDEPAEMGNHTIGNSRRLDFFMQPISSLSTGGILNVEASAHRDFDLNNGPSVDEVSGAPSLFSQHNRSSNVPFQPPVSNLHINNTEMANFSSWFPTRNTYSAVTVPSLLTDREQPFPVVATGGTQRVLGPTTVATPFIPDVFRGSVLSSSPAMPFPGPATPFQYPVFPFGTTFPLPSTSFSSSSTTYVDSSPTGRLCFPTAHSQLLGPASVVPSHYPRPYIISPPDGSMNSGAENGRRWGRQGLDLNAGPGGSDAEGRYETTPLVPRLSNTGSLALAEEEQARMYQAAGGILKRKEPEGGWDGYKQSSWQ